MVLDVYRIIPQFIVIGLIVLFFVSFWLFVTRIITSRKNTEISVRRIEEKLDIIIEKINKDSTGT